MTDEREIDLLDLVAEVIKHWRGAIVCLLIGAIIGGLCGYLKAPGAGEEMTFAQKKAVDIVLEYEMLYVQAEQSVDVEDIINLNKTIIDSIKSFNDTQLQYFTENCNSDLWRVDDVSFLQTSDDGMESQTGAGLMNVKMMLVGGFALSILYLMYWAVLYMIDGHIKVSDDMMTLVNVPQVGFVSMLKEPKFFIDKWIYRLKHHGKKAIDANKAFEIIASNIAANAKKKNITDLSIIGENGEYLGTLTDLLNSKYEIKVNVIDDIVYNEKSIDTVSESRYAVLVEKVGHSLYTDLDKKMQLLNQLEIAIMGAIIVEV